MLGLDQELVYTHDAGETSISFPSMSKLRATCGPGCDWIYVLEIKGLPVVTPLPPASTPGAPPVSSTEAPTNGVTPLRLGNLFLAMLAALRVF